MLVKNYWNKLPHTVVNPPSVNCFEYLLGVNLNINSAVHAKFWFSPCLFVMPCFLNRSKAMDIILANSRRKGLEARIRSVTIMKSTSSSTLHLLNRHELPKSPNPSIHHIYIIGEYWDLCEIIYHQVTIHPRKPVPRRSQGRLWPVLPAYLKLHSKQYLENMLNQYFAPYHHSVFTQFELQRNAWCAILGW